MPLGTMVCLWRERNAKNFEEKEQSIFEIRSFFFHTLLNWNLAL